MVEVHRLRIEGAAAVCTRTVLGAPNDLAVPFDPAAPTLLDPLAVVQSILVALMSLAPGTIRALQAIRLKTSMGRVARVKPRS